MKMYKIVLSLISMICLTTGQWMQYMDNNMTPYPSVNTLSEELILPKDTTNIPIIVLLKPRRGKSLNTDNEGNLEPRSDNGQPLDINQWIGMPQLNGDNNRNEKNNFNQHLIDLGKAFESQQSMSVLPLPNTSGESEKIMLKGRGDERIQWPLKEKKPSLSPATLQQISHLLPNFAALSQSNLGLGKLSGSSGGSLFEDALKRFTSNLTDLEHNISGSADGINTSTHQISRDKNDGNNDSEENSSDSSDSSIENKSSTNSDDIKVDEGIESGDNEDNRQSYAEQRDSNGVTFNDNQDLIQKSSPIQAERQIRIPIITETDQKSTETQKGFQPISETPVNRGWLPIKNRKSKTKPALHERHKQLSSTKTATTSFTGYNQQKNPFFGMPELSSEFPGILRPRRYYSAVNPSFNPSFNPMFNNRDTIRQLPFSKYSSYLSESDISPALHALEMHGDANKPQHMDPIKAEPVIGEEHVKQKGHEEEKEHVIDEKHEGIMEQKHEIDEKHMSLGQGFGGHGQMGEHQLSCCEQLLHNQHNGYKHIINEGVIGSHFDDEKLIHNMVLSGHKQHQPIHHHFQHNNHHFPSHHKLGCHEELGFGHDFNGGQQFGNHFPWPQQVYRRPPMRPKFGLFSKPIFWG